MRSLIGSLFGSVDAFLRAIRNGVRSGLARLRGPLGTLAFYAVLGLTGARIVIGDVLSRIDAVLGGIEKAAAFVGLLAMTLLAFNDYLQREFKPRLGSMGGLWDIDGQVNIALLLLVIVGFLGASQATRDGKHIAVDAMDKVLSPGAARFVKRFQSLASAAVCALLAKGAFDGVFTSSKDTFEGVNVFAWMVAPINALVALLPGEKFGPGTAFESLMAWEDAKFEANLDPFKIPAFGFVKAGDGFPLWIPLGIIAFLFATMAARFAGAALTVPPPDPFAPQRPGSRRPIDVILAGGFPGALLALGLAVWWGTGTMIVVAAILVVLLGAPLFVGVGVGTIASWILLREGSAEVVVGDMFEAAKKQELLAIPFFVLAGNLMTEGSIARRLVHIARVALASVPGGLGVAAVLACAFFAAISGSSPVTVIAIGSVMFPMLIADRYDENYSLGVLSSAGSLGIIIPPSVPMLIYAIMVSGQPGVGVIDPTALFAAGIVPGLLIATCLILYTWYVTWPRAGTTSSVVAYEVPAGSTWARELGKATIAGLPSLMLPVVILGGIYGFLDLRPFGIDFVLAFTVTESAAVAVVYALFVELFINRELKLRQIPKAFSDSALQMGSLFLVIMIAISLNRFFAFEQLPERATAWMLSMVDSKLGFLLAVNIFLLILGCLMDMISAILITAPLLAPIATQYGIHPIHFAIMFIVNLEIGYLTPPMGINLFVASTVFDRPLLKVIRAAIPFVFVMLFSLFMIAAFPWISLVFDETPMPEPVAIDVGAAIDEGTVPGEVAPAEVPAEPAPTEPMPEDGAPTEAAPTDPAGEVAPGEGAGAAP
jgi:C4-dicarboxylate transporter DctM subunit